MRAADVLTVQSSRAGNWRPMLALSWALTMLACAGFAVLFYAFVVSAASPGSGSLAAVVLAFLLVEAGFAGSWLILAALAAGPARPFCATVLPGDSHGDTAGPESEPDRFFPLMAGASLVLLWALSWAIAELTGLNPICPKPAFAALPALLVWACGLWFFLTVWSQLLDDIDPQAAHAMTDREIADAGDRDSQAPSPRQPAERSLADTVRRSCIPCDFAIMQLLPLCAVAGIALLGRIV